MGKVAAIRIRRISTPSAAVFLLAKGPNQSAKGKENQQQQLNAQDTATPTPIVNPRLQIKEIAMPETYSGIYR